MFTIIKSIIKAFGTQNREGSKASAITKDSFEASLKDLLDQNGIKSADDEADASCLVLS